MRNLLQTLCTFLHIGRLSFQFHFVIHLLKIKSSSSLIKKNLYLSYSHGLQTAYKIQVEMRNAHSGLWNI